MPSMRLPIFVVAGFLASSAAIRQKESSTAYQEFRKKFGVERPHGRAASYRERFSLFVKRQEEVRQHNAKHGVMWLAAVNKFADYTEAEFHGMLGHSRRGRDPRAASSAFLEVQAEVPLAQAVDWSQILNSSNHPKDQGGCGSCWAVATAGALETHAEIAAQGPAPQISYEQLVDCVENPDECGGQGGCGGATSELALEYVSKHGLAAKADYKGYQSGEDSGTCKTAANPPVLGIQGFVRLPENQVQPLLEAIATLGPVVVSADAREWSPYSSGVFDSCMEDAVVDHAILAMGYGSDAKLKVDFWLLRNSWGPDWGEHGYLRLLRHSGSDYCGTDRRPLDGVGCKRGPSAWPATLPVCGMCGVLSDSAYPTGVRLLSQTLV